MGLVGAILRSESLLVTAGQILEKIPNGGQLDMLSALQIVDLSMDLGIGLVGLGKDALGIAGSVVGAGAAVFGALVRKQGKGNGGKGDGKKLKVGDRDGREPKGRVATPGDTPSPRQLGTSSNILAGKREGRSVEKGITGKLGGSPKAKKEANAPKSSNDEHHIMTNKNSKSKAAGGPYTPKFEALAKKRGITLEDVSNKMHLPDHQGPHPEYNKVVYNRMKAATNGLKGDAFNQAFDTELAKIRNVTATPGTILNRLATGG
jgi:hypothetical protein